MNERPKKDELEATQQTIKFLEALLRASADGVVITDATQNIVVVNEAFCTFFDQRYRDVIETSLLGWLEQLDGDGPRCWCELEKRTRDAAVCRNIEFHQTTDDGVRHLSVNASLLEQVACEEHGLIISSWRDITEYWQAEEALRASKEELQAIYNGAVDGMMILDNQTREFVRANSAMCDMLGYSERELSSMSLADMVPSDHVPQATADFAEAAERKSSSWTNIPFLRKNGEVFFVDISARPINYRGHRCTIGFFRDITNRKRTEEALRESERRSRAILDHTFQFIGLMTPDGILIEANRTALDFAGIGESDALGKPFWDTPWWTHSSELQDQLRDAVRRAAAGDFVRLEATHPAADGTIHSVDFSLKPVMDESGNVDLLIPEGRDITERKRAEEELNRHREHLEELVKERTVELRQEIVDRKEAEEALRESRRALSMLISNLPGMVYRCRNDPDWTMEFVSEGCLDLTGHPSSAFVNSTVVSYAGLIHPDDRETVWNDVQSALRERRAFQLLYRIVTDAGKEKWVWEQGRGVFSDRDELLALEGFITDITDRKQAEEERRKLEAQLRQAQKMEAVGQLAGGVAHDFNNILTAILGNADISLEALKSRLGTNDPVLDGLGQIQESAQRAADLTRQLLVFSRQDVARPEVLDLNRTLAEMEKMLRRLVTEAIDFRFAPAPGIHCIRADAGQIEQVILNLVVNARDAMPDGGRLTLETADVVLEESHVAAHAEAQPGPHVLLAVSDTGCGMDGDTRERIFEPFFTTKPAGHGTGLGLATVYAICKHAGGHIMVYSEPGRGTTFKVHLPAIEESPEERRDAAAETATPTGSETVLVCEDDGMVRQLAAHLLRDAGYTVIEAENGARALQLAAEHGSPIHLLVTDVIMPDMNGAKLAEALTAARPQVRTLFVSGYTSNVIAHHGVLDEGVEFLEKPFSGRALRQRVRDILDRAGRQTHGSRDPDR